MPLTKKSYTFKETSASKLKRKEMSENDHHTPTTPLLGKIKTRGRSFIGSKTPKHHDRTQEEDEMPFLSPFLRSSVKLKSFRKRKMANREDNQVDGSLNKKLFLGKDEIELKIEENIKMRDGIMKLINGCHDAKQAVDISKNLLTINSRVLSLMSSLQKKRSTSILKDYNQKQSKDGQALNVNEACLGQVCISDIRIPLMWKADSHFKTKPGEPATLLYHMFCLLKIADQVYDTPLIQFNQIDTDVTFEDLYIFHDVPADFKLEVEVYYTVMHNPDNPVWTPMRSQRKTVYESAPKYCLAAHSQLTIDGIKEGFVTSDFVMGSQGASVTAVLGQVDDLPENPLALWGQFSCYLRAKPACMLKDVAEGSMYFQTSNGGQPSWEKYFCRLRHCTIQGWKHYPQKGEAFQIEPNLSIKIKENMEVRVEKSHSEDKNVLILTSSVTEKEPVISFDSACDFDKWRKALNQVIRDAKSWKTACDQLMQFETIASKRHLIKRPLSNFYYDQFHVEQNDIVPKSPRSAKKSLRVLSKPAELGSKRSFYDLIDISEETVTQTNKENGDLNIVNNGTTPSFKDNAMDMKGEAMEEDTPKTTDQNGEETSNAVTSVEMSSRPSESVGQLVNDSVAMKSYDIAVVQKLEEAEHEDESLPSAHVAEDIVGRHEDVEIVEEDLTATTATAGALEEVEDNTEDAAALSLESNEDEDVDMSMEEDVGEKIFEELNSLVSSELESTPQRDVSSSFDIEASSGQELHEHEALDSLEVKDVSLLKESRNDSHGEDDGTPNEAVECLKDNQLSEDEEGDKSLEGLNVPEVIDNGFEDCTNDDSKVSEGREESEESADRSNVENCDESHIQCDEIPKEEDQSLTEDSRSDAEVDQSHIEDDQSNIEDDESNLEDDQSNIEVDQSNIEVDQSHIEDDQSNIEADQSHIEDVQSITEIDQSNIEADQSNLEDEQSNIEVDQSNIEVDQSHIEDDQSNIEADQSHIEDVQSITEIDQSNIEADQSNIEVDQSHIEDIESITEIDQSNIEDDQSNLEDDQSNIEVDQSHIEDDQSNIEDDLSNIESITANEHVQSENNDDSFSINDSELVKTPTDNSISTTEQFDNPERNGDEELNLKTNDLDGQSKTVSDTHEKTIKIQTDV